MEEVWNGVLERHVLVHHEEGDCDQLIYRKKLYYWVVYGKECRPCDKYVHLRSRWEIGYRDESVPDISKGKRGKKGEPGAPLTNLVTVT